MGPVKKTPCRYEEEEYSLQKKSWPTLLLHLSHFAFLRFDSLMALDPLLLALKMINASKLGKVHCTLCTSMSVQVWDFLFNFNQIALCVQPVSPPQIRWSRQFDRRKNRAWSQSELEIIHPKSGKCGGDWPTKIGGKKYVNLNKTKIATKVRKSWKSTGIIITSCSNKASLHKTTCTMS